MGVVDKPSAWRSFLSLLAPLRFDMPFPPTEIAMQWAYRVVTNGTVEPL